MYGVLGAVACAVVVVVVGVTEQGRIVCWSTFQHNADLLDRDGDIEEEGGGPAEKPMVCPFGRTDGPVEDAAAAEEDGEAVKTS